MDKVICIVGNYSSYGFEEGNLYYYGNKVCNCFGIWYSFGCNIGDYNYIWSKFIKLEDFRDNKINSIIYGEEDEDYSVTKTLVIKTKSGKKYYAKVTDSDDWGED